MQLNDQVEIRFRVWTVDTMQSIIPERLKTFRVGDGTTLKAIDQGILGMKAGSTRLLVVPFLLAYGPNGDAKNQIPPGTDVVLEVDSKEFHRSSP